MPFQGVSLMDILTCPTVRFSLHLNYSHILKTVHQRFKLSFQWFKPLEKRLRYRDLIRLSAKCSLS